MNNNIVEILSIIVKRILDNDNLSEPDEELVQLLLDQGYPWEDIDAVLKLVSGIYTDCLIDLTPLRGLELSKDRQRVLTSREKAMLTPEALGIIEKVMAVGLFDLQRIEFLFLTLFNTFETPIDLKSLWEGLKCVFEECELEVISRIIPAFNDYNVFYKHHLN